MPVSEGSSNVKYMIFYNSEQFFFLVYDIDVLSGPQMGNEEQICRPGVPPNFMTPVPYSSLRLVPNPPPQSSSRLKKWKVLRPKLSASALPSFS